MTAMEPMHALRRSPIVIAAALCLASASALAVNRCVDAKGKVTYQDIPCEAAAVVRPTDAADPQMSKTGRTVSTASPDPGAIESNPYGNAHGTWRGPAQFQLTVAGARDNSAQVVTPIVVELRPTGEVVGTIREAGCTLSGLTMQFVTANMASLDVSIKGCRDARLNARYSGTLISNSSTKEAKLSLHSIATQMPSLKMQVASLEAVLKR